MSPVSILNSNSFHLAVLLDLFSSDLYYGHCCSSSNSAYTPFFLSFLTFGFVFRTDIFAVKECIILAFCVCIIVINLQLSIHLHSIYIVIELEFVLLILLFVLWVNLY
jgi:hypothetical protein